MPKGDQPFLSLAGEFAVASELNRRHVLASVTYGASKCADVFALSPDMGRVIRIVVKATIPKRKTRWLIGAKGTIPADVRNAEVFWVLVLLPSPLDGVPVDQTQRGDHATRFFVLSPREVYEAWQKEYADFIERRGGRPFTGRGVPGVRLQDVKGCEGQWGKILSRLQNSPNSK